MLPPPPPPMQPVQPVPPPAAWPTMAQQHAEVQREVAPAPHAPVPTWQEREAQYEERERSEISRGIMAAMRRAEVPPQPPAPPPGRRGPYASAPSPGPLPLPIRPEAEDRYISLPGPRAPLPGRLQDKIDLGMANEDPVATPLRGILIAVSVLATLTIMLILMQRFGAIDVPFLRGAAGSHATRTDGAEGTLLTPAQVDPTAALIDSLKREVESAKQASGVRPAATAVPQTTIPQATPPSHARAVSPSTVAAPPGGNPTGARVATQQVSPPTGAEPVRANPDPVAPSAPQGTGTASTGATSTPAASSTHFGIGVVSYLDEARAKLESDRLSQDTFLPSTVLPYRDAGTTMYRVVVGRFATVREAERNANTLMEKGLINEARVVTVPG
jgi:hypothetical protein